MDQEVAGRPGHGAPHRKGLASARVVRVVRVVLPASAARRSGEPAGAPAARPAAALDRPPGSPAPAAGRARGGQTPGPSAWVPGGQWRRRPAYRELLALTVFLAAGVAVTWPRATYLAGRLPATRDAGGYVWGFWWVAHQVTHLGNPWATTYLAAPVGTQLGYHTLMPLPGLLLTPVTLAFGPSFSYNLLSVACPGLLAYAMCRAARLWLPTGPGAYAAGALFGFSAILSWRSWYEVNLAAGALFFPLALEASVRMRRTPGVRRALVLGAVLGASALTDQESAVMTAILTVLVLLPWLAHRPALGKLRATALAAAAAAAVASPQIVAMARQAMAGGASTAPHILAIDYAYSGAGLEQLFTPSPRLANFGLTALARPYYNSGPLTVVVVGYGVVLTALALLGLVIAWRRRNARLLALLWLGCSALSLGSCLWIGRHRYVPLAVNVHGVNLSALMPFTWFARIPGLSNFREADRFTELALVAAALLAGSGIAWLSTRTRPVLVATAALAALETGWAGNPALGLGPIAAMPTAMPALSGPIAADHSDSVVVAVPFGIRGGLPVVGWAFPPQTMVLATADAHPLADAFISRIPTATRTQILSIPFYADLIHVQGGARINSPAAILAAERSARRLRIDWVMDWMWRNRAVTHFLHATGFRLRYRADGAWVFHTATLSPSGEIQAVRVPEPGTAERGGTVHVNGHAKRARSRPARRR